MGPATKTVTLEGRFPMHRAGHLDSPTLAYETWGELNEARDNAILIFSGLSPSAHAASSAEDPSAGWWEDMIGPGLPLDSDLYHVICVNSLGSCFGSTGAAYGVVHKLGIKKLHTVIGCSMGGMSGLAFCVRHPEAAQNFISISSSTRALPFSIAFRSLQREMIRCDPKLRPG
jgi:homoserine O-acetyltransferase